MTGAGVLGLGGVSYMGPGNSLPPRPPSMRRENSGTGRTLMDEFNFKEDAINAFVSQTGDSAESASFYLESCNWDKAAAIEMHKGMSS